ncbi:MAG: L-threonylcarbamoyladenylate synthase, partial [Hyphomicrobiales bacterium]
MVTPKDIADAARALHEGKLVVMPTETVYGLGANALSDEAVAGIYAAKQRPEFNPLIVHVADIDAAEKLGAFKGVAKRLARAFWPGALTLVVPKTPKCQASRLATAGLKTIALRVPAHPIAKMLLNAADLPIAAPSANVSGKLSPTRIEHLQGLDDKNISAVLDAGATEVGVESTIVACNGDKATLLRPGGISRADIEKVLRAPLGTQKKSNKPNAPGQLESHYAPKASIRLNVSETAPNEGLLAFGAAVLAHAGPVRNLSPSGDMQEAAANLFSFLHELDAEADRIAVMTIPDEGLGEAINDRLRRAA